MHRGRNDRTNASELEPRCWQWETFSDVDKNEDDHYSRIRKGARHDLVPHPPHEEMFATFPQLNAKSSEIVREEFGRICEGVAKKCERVWLILYYIIIVIYIYICERVYIVLYIYIYTYILYQILIYTRALIKRPILTNS